MGKLAIQEAIMGTESPTPMLNNLTLDQLQSLKQNCQLKLGLLGTEAGAKTFIKRYTNECSGLLNQITKPLCDQLIAIQRIARHYLQVCISHPDIVVKVEQCRLAKAVERISAELDRRSSKGEVETCQNAQTSL